MVFFCYFLKVKSTGNNLQFTIYILEQYFIMKFSKCVNFVEVMRVLYVICKIVTCNLSQRKRQQNFRHFSMRNNDQNE